MRAIFLTIPLAVTACALSGCRGFLLSVAADAATETGASYASEDDPELVRLAAPFGLKTLETLLSSEPRNEKLLTALASDYSQYTYGFVQTPAEEADWSGKLNAAREGRDRARRLFLRARDYGLRGLDLRHPGLAPVLKSAREPARALAVAEKEDVPLLYWTGAAWALAISDGKTDMQLVAELPVPVAMMERALALDESWDEGAIHEFFITYDAMLSPAQGGGPERAREHLGRALALSRNEKLGPWVAYAEGVLVNEQNKAEFTRVLEQVLAADPQAVPQYRLVNIFAQRRARALLARAEDLFL